MNLFEENQPVSCEPFARDSFDMVCLRADLKCRYTACHAINPMTLDAAKMSGRRNELLEMEIRHGIHRFAEQLALRIQGPAVIEFKLEHRRRGYSREEYAVVCMVGTATPLKEKADWQPGDFAQSTDLYVELQTVRAEAAVANRRLHERIKELEAIISDHSATAYEDSLSDELSEPPL